MTQPRVIYERVVIDRRSGVERRQENRWDDEKRLDLIRRVADRVPVEVQSYLEDWHGAALPPDELFERLINRLAASVSEALAVHPEDVGILLLKDRGHLLRFAYPPLHFEGGMNLFPVKISSLAGQVLLTGRGRIDNDVTLVRHLDIYERIRGREKAPSQIQKMVTVPLLLSDGQPLGVLQVSRRGQSAEEAGVDFAPYDLLKLRDLSRALAPVIREVVPVKF